MALITNTTFGKIVDELERRNTIIAGMSQMFGMNTWDMIQYKVRTGHASDYAVGTELETTYAASNGTTYTFPWIVIDNNRKCYWQDGTEHPGLWLAAKYGTPEYIDFDAKEGVEATEETAASGMSYVGVSGTTYTLLSLSVGDSIPYSSYDSVLKGTVHHAQPYKDGYNRYKDSALRQWLNSDGGKGEWWTATHTGDNAPTVHSSYNGFMHGLPDDFLAVINPVKIQTVANSSIDGGVTDVTYDRFFSPSLEEIYAVAQVDDVEGPYFPYWKTATGLNSPSNGASNDTNAARFLHRVNNTSGESNPHLRSASKNTCYNVWGFGNGYINNNVARHTRNVHPCCVIS